MNQSCLLGDLWLCHGLWDGAMGGAGGKPQKCRESGHALGSPLPPVSLFLDPHPHILQAAMCILCIPLSHIPPSNVFILLHMYCKSPTTVLFPSLLREASTILLRVPSQWENADAWQVAPKTPTEKEYLENILRIGANAKAQESQDRHVISKCTANHSSDSLTVRHTSMETASPHLFIFCVWYFVTLGPCWPWRDGPAQVN